MDDQGLPRRAFFSCSADELVILDAEEAKRTLGLGNIEPWMTFKKGPGNIIETTPRRVIQRQDDMVTVECEDGTVFLDFKEGTAHKQVSGKKMVYMGGLDQRNDGLGYIPMS